MTRQAFLCTDQEAGLEDILSWFVRRWTVEVTFAEVRRHLGVETQRQWSDRAIARTTPVLLGLYALVAIWADDLHRFQTLVVRSPSWSRKTELWCQRRSDSRPAWRSKTRPVGLP